MAIGLAVDSTTGTSLNMAIVPQEKAEVMVIGKQINRKTMKSGEATAPSPTGAFPRYG